MMHMPIGAPPFPNGTRVRCIGNRGLEAWFPSNFITEIETSVCMFGHWYVYVKDQHGQLRKHIRAHRFEREEA